MKLAKKSDAGGEIAGDMTPMIDVIFQLVLFFVFSMKFIAFEGQLQAYLPKDRGQGPGTPVSIDPITATIFLEWASADGGRVIARTDKYYSPDGQVVENYQFPMDPGLRLEAGPDGTPRAQTESKVQGPTRQHTVRYDFAVPQWTDVEQYLGTRKAMYDQKKQGLGEGLPVTVNFTNQVPWQAITNVLDICTRLKITNFALNMTESDGS